MAITNDDIQVTNAFSTDGMLLKYKLVILEDDKHFFPVYDAIPIIREEAAKRHLELQGLLSSLSDILTDDALQEMNYRADVLNEEPAHVARQFLESRGLLD
jgi:osmoprotectant transport system substrate-binding protein